MEGKRRYKRQPQDVEGLRNCRRQDDIEFRKEKREWILNAKRFRVDNVVDEIPLEQVYEATKNLKSAAGCKKSLETLRRAFSQGTLFIDAFFSVDNALYNLVRIFTGTDPELQLDAAWCLTNISAGTDEHVMAVVKAAAPYLITYLSSSIHLLQDQSAWALGNIAGNGAECQDILRAQGAISPLLALLQCPAPSVVQSAAFALSNLARDSSVIQRDLIEQDVLSKILPFLSEKTTILNLLGEVGWILTYLTSSQEYVDELLRAGILSRLLDMLVSLAVEEPHNGQVVTPLLRCLGNICAGKDEHSLQVMENSVILVTLDKFLQSKHRHIVKETLWVLSNMSAVSLVAEKILSCCLLPSVIARLSSTFDIQLEAAYVLCNLCTHSSLHCTQLLGQGTLQKMVPLLKSTDLELVRLSLGFTEMACRLTDQGKCLFEECGGLNYLEGLEYHNNDAVRMEANEILENYFYIEEEEIPDYTTLHKYASTECSSTNLV